jgi:hypothetical protein
LPWNPRTAATRSVPTANQAHLLMAASLRRVFELAAPDAPGLISFGVIDPRSPIPCTRSPMVGVSGVGLTLQEAFQGCIGEGRISFPTANRNRSVVQARH